MDLFILSPFVPTSPSVTDTVCTWSPLLPYPLPFPFPHCKLLNLMAEKENSASFLPAGEFGNGLQWLNWAVPGLFPKTTSQINHSFLGEKWQVGKSPGILSQRHFFSWKQRESGVSVCQPPQPSHSLCLVMVSRITIVVLSVKKTSWISVGFEPKTWGINSRGEARIDKSQCL